MSSLDGGHGSAGAGLPRANDDSTQAPGNGMRCEKCNAETGVKEFRTCYTMILFEIQFQDHNCHFTFIQCF